MEDLEQAPSALFFEWIDAVAMALSLAGVIVIAGGMTVATLRACLRRTDPSTGRYVQYRRDVGKAILLGLEFMVAADIVETVSVAPTIDSVIVLAGIVLIRTFLSLALEVELKGRWPWQPSVNGKTSQRSRPPDQP
jgi:uncharacterized membrane protein